MSSSRVVLSFILVLALLSGASFHAIVPHSHAEAGHAHSHKGEAEETSVVWQALHAALRGEEQNMFGALLPLFALLVLVVPIERRRFVSETGSFFAPLSIFEALKKGILEYRRFA